MAFYAFPTYTREVAPSGNVPQSGALPGLWAAAQAGQAQGSAMRRLGGELQGLAARRDEEDRRQSQVNLILGNADLEKMYRRTLRDMNDPQWKKEARGRWIETADRFTTESNALTDQIEKQLHPDDRETWRATTAAQNQRRRDGILDKAAEAREECVQDEAIRNYINALSAGDVVMAATFRDQARELFGNDELWQAEEARANVQIIWNLAQQGEINMAKALIKELIPAAKQQALEENIDDYAEYDAQRIDQIMQQAKQARKEEVYDQIPTDSSGAMNKIIAAPEFNEAEDERETLLGYATNSVKPRVTKATADNEGVEVVLKAAARKEGVDPAAAQERLAELAFTEQALTNERYAEIRSLKDMDPATATMALGLIDSVRRQTTRGIRQLGAFKNETEQTVADTTQFVIAEMARLKESGKEINQKELDIRAREFAAAQERQPLADFIAATPAPEADINLTPFPMPKSKTKSQRDKGPGFFGELPFHDGRTSTELSIGVEIDGEKMEIPSLVPTLTREQIDHMLAGKKPTQAIVDKAVAHARERIKAGKDVFAQPGEQVAAPGGTSLRQLRMDTPPELRARIRRLLARGVDPKRILDADEVKPYVMGGQ